MLAMLKLVALGSMETPSIVAEFRIALVVLLPPSSAQAPVDSAAEMAIAVAPASARATAAALEVCI